MKRGEIPLKINRLTYLNMIEKHKGKNLYIYKCDCGNIVKRPVSDIRSGNTKSCGCYRKETAAKTALKRKGVPASEALKIHLRTISKGFGFGPKNYAWKGGVNPLNDSIRNCEKYVHWRREVFLRDKYTCQKCGKTGGYLEAHHKRRFREVLKINFVKTFEQAMACDQLWDIKNGITLCRLCHNKTKGKTKIRGLCYVAGPYSSDTALGTLENIRRGTRKSVELLLKKWAVFTPWADHQLFLQLRGNEKITVDRIKKHSMAWLEVSDMVYVLRGWEKSEGTKDEIKRARELQIPITFEDDEK